MKTSTKTIAKAVAIIVVLLFILMNLVDRPNNQKSKKITQPVTDFVEKPSCIDETELNAWFQVRIDEEAKWQRINYRFYFAAKRMAADPWIVHQEAMNLKPNGGIEGIKAYNKSNACEIEMVKHQQSLWDQWHNARMLSLEYIKASYPKMKEAQ